MHHTFIDEEKKIETYEKIRLKKADTEVNIECPGIRILCSQGMFMWMAISWADLMAADREEKINNAEAGTECISEMVSMIASLIFR